MLNGGNLLAIAGGYWLLCRLPEGHRRLKDPASVLYVLAGICAAALTAASFGSVADPILFDGTPLGGFTYWGATELVNMIAFLPMLLALPSRGAAGEAWAEWRAAGFRSGLLRLLPIAVLVLSGAVSVLIGGPGAVAFPVPILLWCAVTYPVFATACLCFCYVVWSLLSISSGMMQVAVDFASRPVLLSTRVGVALVALAPLAVSIVMAARNDLVARLRHVAHHDPLTGLPNRAAFFARAPLALDAALRRSLPVACLMLDIDHFKAVNDTHGHRGGDDVLRRFADVLASGVRQRDVFARLGGEEFVVLLPDCDADTAIAVARRISEGFASAPIQLGDGKQIRVTISIGAAQAASPCGIDELLANADAALYRAKLNGRNRIERFSASESAAG